MGRIIVNEQYTATMGYRPMNYTYDLAGNSKTYTDGVGETYTQIFDTAGRGTQLNSSWVDSQHPATMLSGISYNPANAMKKLTYGNGLTQTAAFNNALQPCRVNLNSSSTALGTCTDAIPSGNVQDFNYGFNAGSSDNGNVATWTAAGQQAFSRSFTYDVLNRLASLNQSSGNATGCSSTFSLSWNYDAWGNRTDQNVTGGTCNAFHATLNSQNQLSGSPYQYDAAGNMIHDGNHTYFYDAENRLVQVDGAFGTCSGAIACYLYDAFGHRTTKSVGTAKTNYIYDLDGSVISEVDQSNVWMNVYLRMNGQFVAQYLIGSPRTQFILSDHLGSARVLTKYDGTLVDSLDLLPFGEQIAGASVTTHKFTGDERDSETSLDHTQFRQYTSSLARWITPDPAGLASVDPTNPQSWNRYAYALNDPIDYVDPSGLCEHMLYDNATCLDQFFAGGLSSTCIVNGVDEGCGKFFQLFHGDKFAVLNAAIAPTSGGQMVPNPNLAGCPPGADCPLFVQSPYVYGNLGLLAFITAGGNGSAIGRNNGISADEQRIRNLGRAVVNLAQGPMNVLTVVAGAEAAVPLIAAAPGVYATASEFANVGFGELIPQAGEFVDAATADLVIPRTAAALAGGTVAIVRKIACGIQNDKPWYCF